MINPCRRIFVPNDTVQVTMLYPGDEGIELGLTGTVVDISNEFDGFYLVWITAGEEMYMLFSDQIELVTKETE